MPVFLALSSLRFLKYLTEVIWVYNYSIHFLFSFIHVYRNNLGFIYWNNLGNLHVTMFKIV